MKSKYLNIKKNGIGANPIVNNLYSINSNPSKTIKENCYQNLRFNVMPDKHVDESVSIKEYRLWDDAIEAIFDRSYKTDMINSPSHLTFLSSLINLQKMVYVFMHHYLSIDYDITKKERLKVWPGKLSIDMPKMILDKENISHLMIIKNISKIKDGRYKVFAHTTINDIISISGEALIVIL